MPQPSLDDILAGRASEHRVLHSPAGTHFIVLHAMEAFNSQWVENGTLYDSRRQPLAQIGEWQWHIDSAEWAGEDEVTLSLRRYPGDAPSLVLALQMTARQAVVDSTGTSVPFADLSDWLELWYKVHRVTR